MTSEQTNLTPQLEAAEKAVTAIKDRRLREIAFGRILDHLLGSKDANLTKAESTPTGKRPGSGISTGRRPKPTQVTSPAPQNSVKTGPADGIRRLIQNGKLDSPRSRDETAELLKKEGRHYAKDVVGVALLRLARERVLTRLKEKGDKNWKYVIRR